MTYLANAEIQKMEVKILIMKGMLDNYINSKTMAKLSWAEIYNIELKKLEYIINKIRAKFLSIENEKQKRTNPTTSKVSRIIQTIKSSNISYHYVCIKKTIQ